MTANYNKAYKIFTLVFLSILLSNNLSAQTNTSYFKDNFRFISTSGTFTYKDDNLSFNLKNGVLEKYCNSDSSVCIDFLQKKIALICFVFLSDSPKIKINIDFNQQIIISTDGYQYQLDTQKLFKTTGVFDYHDTLQKVSYDRYLNNRFFIHENYAGNEIKSIWFETETGKFEIAFHKLWNNALSMEFYEHSGLKGKLKQEYDFSISNTWSPQFIQYRQLDNYVIQKGILVSVYPKKNTFFERIYEFVKMPRNTSPFELENVKLIYSTTKSSFRKQSRWKESRVRGWLEQHEYFKYMVSSYLEPFIKR